MLKVERCESNDREPIHCHYANQIFAQPSFIELDLEREILRADYSGEIGNGVPSDVWNNTTIRWPITPHLSAGAINAVLDEIKYLAALLIAESEIKHVAIQRRDQT